MICRALSSRATFSSGSSLQTLYYRVCKEEPLENVALRLLKKESFSTWGVEPTTISDLSTTRPPNLFLTLLYLSARCRFMTPERALFRRKLLFVAARFCSFKFSLCFVRVLLVRVSLLMLHWSEPAWVWAKRAQTRPWSCAAVVLRGSGPEGPRPPVVLCGCGPATMVLQLWSCGCGLWSCGCGPA